MSPSVPLDYLPLWALVGCIAAAIVGLIEGGYRFGKYRCQVSEAEATAPLGTIVGSILGLLAFMLAFTFSLAASRFEARRQMVVQEANSIGTTFLRAGLLPEAQANEVRGLLKEYVASRLEVTKTGDVQLALRRADDLHLRLWQNAEAIGKAEADSVAVGLFTQALNDTIDTHSERVLVGLRSRLPLILWLALIMLLAFSMLGVGYHEALAKSKRSPATFLLVLAFLTVLTLIVDLDRPMEGLITVSQEAMLNLQQMMDSFH